ncbi:MAG: hypothetical protein RL095_1980 [Verrucomicrobiota bacterium]|jgi:hypothetical protein
MISRRHFLKSQAALAAAWALTPLPLAAAPAKAVFQQLYDAFAAELRRLYQACEVEIDGRHLLRPCDNPAYKGLWHDDFTWPHVGLPELMRKRQVPDALAWLGDAMLQLPVLADRVEYDGTAVLSPGGASAKAMSEDMPLHLPAAWTRLLSHAEAAGHAIPRKAEWAALVERSFAQVPHSFGLVWSNPQKRNVAFGFQDSIRLTGLVLLTSLVLKRGYERAASLFAAELPAATLKAWRERAAAIDKNLPRLFDAKAGGFLGASVAGRSFDVWGNGLAWPLASAEQKQVIAATMKANQDKIFLKGCTRQIIGPGGWPGTPGALAYQNGGYWGTGTGFVLPMIADIDPAWALALGRELLANLANTRRAEWLDQKGQGQGALEFLGTLSMPLIGLRAILEDKPVLEYL